MTPPDVAGKSLHAQVRAQTSVSQPQVSVARVSASGMKPISTPMQQQQGQATMGRAMAGLSSSAPKVAEFAACLAELAKAAGLPEGLGAPRTRVQGLKQSRLATPRLNPEAGNDTPSNPFRVNWTKLGGSHTGGPLEQLRAQQKRASAELSSIQKGLLGAGVVGVGAATLSATRDQLVNPRPEGVGAGAGARTVQQALLLGPRRAPAAPPPYAQY